MRRCRYLDANNREREGEIVEVNGNLTLVRDAETGAEDYFIPIDFAWKEPRTQSRHTRDHRHG